jgi:hypothetical protein
MRNVGIDVLLILILHIGIHFFLIFIDMLVISQHCRVRLLRPVPMDPKVVVIIRFVLYNMRQHTCP